MHCVKNAINQPKGAMSLLAYSEPTLIYILSLLCAYSHTLCQLSYSKPTHEHPLFAKTTSWTKLVLSSLHGFDASCNVWGQQPSAAGPGSLSADATTDTLLASIWIQSGCHYQYPGLNWAQPSITAALPASRSSVNMNIKTLLLAYSHTR